MTTRASACRCFVAALAPLLIALAPTAALADMASDVKSVNDGWAHITYEVKGSSTQTKALDQLAAQARSVVARYPGKAEPLLWAGIVTSEQANRANFFHKLGLATKARDLIARAYAIDPRAANGGAALSLGVLYYKVPGSPLAWGDEDKAVKLLKQALAVDPNGLDTNYFYGDYLLAQGDKPGARSYLQKALRAPHDAGRPVWDMGRRREVRDLLAKAT
ncbi:tetratricopeptide repeat protein [Novosphingobium sp. BL-52-GroH]|uniref:tetratricopeptide repeat protein n=1 Tax=Novosphingobium sp. BL-52-GroH TaxID=3349877 RepID=UPI0038510D1A